MNAWGLILAGGDGLRLRALTRAIAGDERPKQFCAVVGRQTLLDQSRARAALLIEPARTLIVVNRDHEPFYAPLMADTAPESLVVQPGNVGTAPAILYGLLRVAAVDAAAAVVVLPSDHWVSDDRRFMRYVGVALDAVRAQPDLVVLLGIRPDGPEPDYGWIEPGAPLPVAGLRRVRRFWEKPAVGLAGRLLARGSLCSVFVMVAGVPSLLGLIRGAAPGLARAFGTVRVALGTDAERPAAHALYRRLGPVDFSRHVLAARPARLAVLGVHGVAWSDVGTPERVLALLGRLATRPAWAGGQAAWPA